MDLGVTFEAFEFNSTRVLSSAVNLDLQNQLLDSQ